jgi:hypothetical protein
MTGKEDKLEHENIRLRQLLTQAGVDAAASDVANKVQQVLIGASPRQESDGNDLIKVALPESEVNLRFMPAGVVCEMQMLASLK